MSPRVLAIDWSGALKGERKKIWLAEVVRDRLVRLSCGLTRDEVITWLIDEGRKTPELIVGLDFAFSCPKWFVESKGCDTVQEFWRLAGEEGELWLRQWPFWSDLKPDRTPVAEYRRSEEHLPNRKPSSVFKLVGPAQVGRGSIRGMPHLRRLKRNGFSVWPFDPPAWPQAIEIFPRVFATDVVKTDRDERANFLKKFDSRCPEAGLLDLAVESDDAFDALVSAFTMSDHLDELCSLTRCAYPDTRVEGAIWFPHYRE